jgi:hypothetical protein
MLFQERVVHTKFDIYVFIMTVFLLQQKLFMVFTLISLSVDERYRFKMMNW